MTAPGWRLAPGERSVRFSPGWFRLIDDFTGLSPAGVAVSISRDRVIETFAERTMHVRSSRW